MEQEEKRYSILDELSKCSGYDIALMTTFNFEIGFFERAILNRFYAKDVKTISLFVDAKELTDALERFDAKHSGSHIGKKYMVNPMSMDSSFHPKVILLLGEKKARLFIGSANVKTSGYATNNEVFNYIDYDAKNPEYLDVIVSAIDFFSEINEISYKLDNSVIKAAKEYIYYHKAGQNGNMYLLHNMKEPMLDQVRKIISEDVRSISIAVPYYDNELLALQAIKASYPTADVHLYIQNKYSTFPIDYNNVKHIVDDIKTFSRFNDSTSSTSGNFYHGKVFLFKTKEKSYVLYGSANCTLSAMIKSYADGGNIECDFLEVGNIEDFDYFFDNMDLETDEEFTSQKMVYEPKPALNFTFKYGEIGETIELHIGYSKKPEGLVVKLGEKELEYQIDNGELKVYITEESRDYLKDIFEVSLAYEDKVENLRCWAYNPVALANYRESQSKQDSLNDFEIESSGNKFIEDRIKFFKAEATTATEWQDYKNNLKYMNQIKMEQEGDDGEPEDFIIDFKIPDEYRYAYKQYSAVSKIRSMFVHRFLGTGHMGIIFEDEKDTAGESDYSVDGESPKRVGRKATTEEKRFESFIKGKVKGMMNDVYVDVVELEHYIGIVQVVMEIFEKYCSKDPVEDIFTLDYVVKTRTSFLMKIIGKPIDDIPNRDEMESAIIKKVFSTILINFLYYQSMQEQDERIQYEALNRKLLMTAEKKYSLRQSYEKYIKDIVKEGKGGVLTFGYEKACQYIEQLYGYKTFEMLCQTIKSIYPGAEVINKGSTLRISFGSDHLLDYARPDITVLSEIAKYSRNMAKVDVVYIIIKNTALNPENKNIIIENKHKIYMEYHKWSLSQTRVNGNVIDSKPQYLAF